MMRVGIVGTAFGESRCRMIGDVPQDATLVAVCGRDKERTEAVASRYGAEAVLDYRALVERKDIDVVGIFTSTDLHTGMAVAAAEAGKHVLVTKPTAITVEDAERMLAATRAAGVKLIVEFDTRYEPGPYKIYRAIAEGRLGRLIQGDYVNKCHRGQAYYDEGNRWRAISELGGGSMMNQGVHPIDHLLWYQGPVEGVFAMSGTFAHDIPTEDAASATIRFRNGSLATVTMTTTYRTNLPVGRYGGGTLKRAQVHGVDGSATVEGGKVTDWVMPESEAAVAVPENPPVNVFQDLAWALADPSRPLHTLVVDEDAIAAVYVTNALRRSAATGRYVTIDELRPR